MEIKTIYAYLVTLVFYALFILNYTIGPPYLVSEEVGSRIIYPIISYSFALAILPFLTYYTFKTWRIIGDKRRKESIFYLANFYLFMTLLVAVLLMGIIALASYEESLTPINLLVITIYFYPSTLCIGSLLGATGAFFLFLFGYNNFYDITKRWPVWFYLSLYVITTILIILPQNYYGTIAPGRVSPIRVASQMMLLMLFLIAVLVTAIGNIKRMRIVQDRLLKNRLKISTLGFLFIIGFLIFYVIDALTGIPYSIWMIPGYFSSMTGLVLLYLGFLTPKWFEKIIQKLVKL